MAIRVGINGFGRIGRAVFRAALQRRAENFEVVHINDLTDTETLAHLFKYDSVHGRLGTPVFAEKDALIVDGQKVTVSAQRNPELLPWKERNVDIVLECTGLYKKRSEAEVHIKAGARKVLISAPAKDEDLTIVVGVNDNKLSASHTVVSNASCTTNCLAPVTKVLHDNFGIVKGLMTTVHSYTNDQRVLDLPHEDLRRARAAGLNMIPTTTGAAKAIGLVIPELKGKIDGIAVRVPTPNVSLVDVTFEVTKSTTVEAVNKVLTDAANGAMKGVLAVSREPLVSIDYNGSTFSSVVDAECTTVIGGNMIKVLAWYDNETGFSWRMLDVVKMMSR